MSTPRNSWRRCASSSSGARPTGSTSGSSTATRRARWRRSSRTRSSARRSVRSTRRWSRARYVRAFANAADPAWGAHPRARAGPNAGARGLAHRAGQHGRRDLHPGIRGRRGRGVDAGAASAARHRHPDPRDAAPDRPDDAHGAHARPGALRPSGGQAVHDLPRAAVVPAEHWANEAEVRHGKALLEAVCQRADGSYLLGCAMDYPGFVWEPDLAGVALIAESLPAIMPALRAARFARAWAGVLPFTTDNLPIIDRLPGLRRRVRRRGPRVRQWRRARRPGAHRRHGVRRASRSWTRRRSAPTGPGSTDPVDTSVW